MEKLPRRKKSKEEKKESKAGSRKKYEGKQTLIRISKDNYERWQSAKLSENIATNNEMAKFLLDVWEGCKDQSDRRPSPEQTPSKTLEVPTHSTPADRQSKGALPSRMFGGVSDISDSNGHSSGTSDIEQRYIDKAKQTEGSFVNVTFEVSEKDPDVSYLPTLSEEEEAVSDEETDPEEDMDYTLEMSLRQGSEDLEHAEIKTVADAVFDIEEIETEDEEAEDSEAVPIVDRDIVIEPKVICFEENLCKLAHMRVSLRCDRKNCDGSVILTTKVIGTCMRITWKCDSRGHVMKQWYSQPFLKKKPAGDFLLSCAVLSSGNNYEKIRLLHTLIRLGVTPKTQHYQYQSKHAIPVIKEEFEKMMTRNRAKYIGEEIVILGDGRMDSPGHSAQYCTYTVMENQNKDILVCEIVNKRETAMKSTWMEKEGLKRCLKKLHDSGLIVKEICTDASTSIAAMIRKEYPEIEHSFDVWHGAKNLGKKLGAVASEAKNKDLRVWVPNVINHFWYCSREAAGDENILEDKWQGVIHHVVDEHEWPFGECDHGELDETEEKKWLQTGENAHMALTKVVLDTRFLHNLPYYKNFRHTGELETFHEHILMYCAKRFAYTHPVYKARNYLACLDYQMHKDRGELRNKKGELRLHRKYSKKGNTWTVYTEKEKKEYKYMPSLLGKMIDHFITSTEALTSPVEMTPTDPRKVKRTLSEVTPPPTHSLLKKSRFGDTT